MPAQADDARRFVRAALATAALGVAGCIGLIQLARHTGMETLPASALLAHQLGKLATGVPQVVFVGDSSLGNAIQATHWQAQGGGTAMNLALTGAYGYAGSHHMLRRVLRLGRPALVVVMHTADIASRSPSALTELLIRPEDELRWSERASLAWRMHANPTLLSDAADHLLRQLRGKPARAVAVVENDYVRQGAPLSPPASQTPHPAGLDRLALQPEAMAWLGRIRSLCQSENLRCVYAHGPLHRAVCDASRDYLARLDATLDAQGWHRLAGTPACFDDADLGDSLDHVNPAAKARYTELHLRLVQQLPR